MAGNYSISKDGQKVRRLPTRTWRPWLYGVALWLRNGAGAVAFYLAVRTGIVGILALAAFVGSLLRREVLEAISHGA